MVHRDAVSLIACFAHKTRERRYRLFSSSEDFGHLRTWHLNSRELGGPGLAVRRRPLGAPGRQDTVTGVNQHFPRCLAPTDTTAKPKTWPSDDPRNWRRLTGTAPGARAVQNNGAWYRAHRPPGRCWSRCLTGAGGSAGQFRPRALVCHCFTRHARLVRGRWWFEALPPPQPVLRPTRSHLRLSRAMASCTRTLVPGRGARVQSWVP